MAYDSPFSGAYGGAGPALPPGYMETATQPGRDVQGLLKSIGEKFKERREKKKQAAKELKATRSLAKALGLDRIGMDDESIETSDIDTIMGKIQGYQAKNKERELAVKEEPGQRADATMRIMQNVLGGQADQFRARNAYGEEPGGPRGGPLDQQEENRMRAIESMQPHMQGADPSMIESILSLSQGGGSGAGSVREGPGGSLLLQNSKNAFSVLKGVDQTPSDADKALARQRNAKAEGDERYNELLEGIQGATDTSDMDTSTKKKVTDLEDEIKLAQDNLAKITQLGNDAPFVNYDDGVIDLAKSRKAEGASWWRNSKSRTDAKLEEEQKLKSLQKKLNKLRGESGGAAIPAPPLSFDDSPENLFAE